MADLLRIDDYLPRSQWCHHARREMVWSPELNLHTHDFHEFFWIEQGQAWHLINGRRLPLRAGDLIFIRASDVHDFAIDQGGSCSLVNVAFRRAFWHELFRRCLPGRRDPLQEKALETRSFRLGPAALAELKAAVAPVASGRRDRFQAELLFLNVIRLAGLHDPEREKAPLPDWLEAACEKIRAPEQFLGGVPAFARLAGRSQEHVARTLKQLRGLTPTDVVNEAKLAHAATRLVSTDRKILDVALDAGFPNLGHFYKVFQKRYGVSPRHYRLAGQRLIKPLSREAA